MTTDASLAAGATAPATRAIPRRRREAGRFGIDTFGLGADSGSPVSNAYKPPFALSGARIERVDIKLAPKNLTQSEEDELQERYLAFAQHIE